MTRLFSLDHKVIGLQYAITSMVFLLIGFTLMMLIRWQLAYPGSPLPLVGGLLGESNAPGGVIAPEFYNQLGAMHGTIMIFLGVVPLSVGGFGNYLIPLQIGAPDMAFPRLNMLSYWLYAAGGAVMLTSFVLPGGAANNGWTSYPPLSVISPATGQTEAVVVRVVAEQFAWNVHYPGADGEFGGTDVKLVAADNPLGVVPGSRHAADDVMSVGELVVPVNRPVIVQLSAKDVTHSFGVPVMRVKQDAIPGMMIPVWFTPTRAGEYEITCSQLCGVAHYRMRGILRVVDAAEFQNWLRSQ